MTNAITDWGVAAMTAWAAGLTALLAWVPKLLGAIVVVLIGWAIATACYAIVDRLLRAVHFDQLMARVGVSGALQRAQIPMGPSAAVATVVKWAVWLVTFSVAASTLGLPALSAGIGAIIAYIPNVIAAAVIIGLGLVLANFVRDVVRSAAASANVSMASMLGEVGFWAIAVFAVLGAIGQLDIAPRLVETIYTGVIAAAALAGGLAFGLGLREQARDVLAGRAAAEQLKPGDRVQFADIEGRVQSIGAMKTIIAQDNGALLTVPNRELLEQRVTLKPGSSAQQRLRVTFAPESPAPVSTTSSSTTTTSATEQDALRRNEPPIQ